MQATKSLLFCCIAIGMLTGCTNALNKIDNIGNPPAFSKLENPQAKPEYKPVTWPMPENTPPKKQYANSLWQPGSRAFYRDQRASRVGDILRVTISINDKAEVDNETEATRNTNESVAAPTVFGFERKLAGNFLPGVIKDTVSPGNLLDVTGATTTTGTGSVKREEKITTQVAAMIVQVLPNGNYVIDGKQEIVVNKELREVSVKGVIRPQDLGSDNTIDSTQIAEARITYGGRGQLSDVQQARWGHQVVDALAPF
ncbi:MAG: flagellar basal body L-ring protein FlgH [Rickettsiales bacterium]